MHVHVHGICRQLEIKGKDGLPAAEEDVPVSLTNRVGDQLVTHHAPVDVEILLVRLAAGVGGQPDPAPQPELPPRLVQNHRALHEGVADDPGET
jgi:hypothetical protein